MRGQSKIDNRILLQIRHGAISWKSKLQECTTTSTTEAKYVAASDVAKEALWLGLIVCTFRQADPNSAPVVYNDNQSVVALSKSLVHHNASKIIDVQYHFLWDFITSRKLGLEKICTIDNVSDGMTSVSQLTGSGHFGTIGRTRFRTFM